MDSEELIVDFLLLLDFILQRLLLFARFAFSLLYVEIAELYSSIRQAFNQHRFLTQARLRVQDSLNYFVTSLFWLLDHQSHYCLVLFGKKVCFFEFIGGSEHILDQVRTHHIQIIGVLIGNELLHTVDSNRVPIMIIALESKD